MFCQVALSVYSAALKEAVKYHICSNNTVKGWYKCNNTQQKMGIFSSSFVIYNTCELTKILRAHFFREHCFLVNQSFAPDCSIHPRDNKKSITMLSKKYISIDKLLYFDESLLIPTTSLYPPGQTAGFCNCSSLTITMMNATSTGAKQPFGTSSPLMHYQLICHGSVAACLKPPDLV